MSNIKKLFLVKNLFNYEQIISPPKNLPDDFDTLYVTDSDEIAFSAKTLGWSQTYVTKKFIGVTDLFLKRVSVAYINCFPHEFIPNDVNYNFIFVCDSNIVSLWNNVKKFTDKCTNEYSLHLLNGFYSGERNTLLSELKSSDQGRWSYNYASIKKCYDDYKKELTEIGVDINSLGVCSAKYIMWNPSHKNYKKITEKLYENYKVNLQGNIILTYLSGLYKDDIFVYNNNDYNGGHLNNHNYSA